MTTTAIYAPEHSRFTLSNKPNDAGLWAGIAGNHRNIAQIIEEFVDNSLSNFRRYADEMGLQRKVEIYIDKVSDTKVFVRVSDSGTGILDLDNALTLAGHSRKESPLNEHGFGLKHALASADRENNSWVIMTRTAEDAALNRYREVSAPYTTAEGGMYGKCFYGTGGFEHGTGTKVYFTCPMRLFTNLYKGKFFNKKSFADCVRALEEELRFTYSPILAAGELSICLFAKEGASSIESTLTPLEPNWDEFEDMPSLSADLGHGKVEISCRHGLLHSSKQNIKYYKCNMASSGVELRINGRAITHGQMASIWGLSLHPSQNRFCAVIDVRSEDAAALPSTKSAKNGLREDDAHTEALYAWIRSNVTLPRKWSSQEAHLLDKLAAVQRAVKGVVRVEREAIASRTMPLKGRIDLFVSGEDGVKLYEAKVRRSKEDHVYQLRRYWDTTVADGIELKEAILVACSHPIEVRCMVDFVNKLTDPAGKPYNIRLSTWREEGVPFDDSVENAYSI